MNPTKKIKVTAADIITGGLLDENFDWYTDRETQVQWQISFESRHETLEFCKSEVLIHPDVEFWISDDSVDDDFRVVNPKWERGQLEHGRPSISDLKVQNDLEKNIFYYKASDSIWSILSLMTPLFFLLSAKFLIKFFLSNPHFKFYLQGIFTL